jgi:hypothetical protein
MDCPVIGVDDRFASRTSPQEVRDFVWGGGCACQVLVEKPVSVGFKGEIKCNCCGSVEEEGLGSSCKVSY